MNSSSSEQSAAVTELNQLFEEGAEKGLWEKDNRSDCARVIDVSRRDLSRFLIGEREHSISSVLQKMRDAVHRGVLPEVLGQATEEETIAAETKFDHFYQMGIQKELWHDMESCARALEMTAMTVSKYRKTPAETLRGTSVKGKTTYDKTLGKMKTYVQRRRGPQTPRRSDVETSGGQTEQISEAPRAIPQSPASQPTSNPPIDLASMISYPAIARIDDLEARLPGLIQSALAQPGRDSQPVLEGVVPSKWAEEVLAGRMEIQNQKKGDVRFIVTAETFRKLLSRPLSREEVGDTNTVAEISANADTELRRRLEALHQMEESPQRAEAIKALVPALAERIRQAVALAITIEKIRECDVDKGLIRAARHFDSLSDIFKS